MFRKRHARSGSFALALLMSACAAPPRAEGDPFATAGRSGPRGDRMYLVQLVVRCEECTVTYQVASSSRSVRSFSPGWNVTLRLYPRYPQRISLSAVGSGVRQARILVDGDVAAEAETDTDDTLPLHVETVIPLPPAAPPPDSLGREGRSETASGH
jgi:hypothetical protein